MNIQRDKEENQRYRHKVGKEQWHVESYFVNKCPTRTLLI